MMIARNAGSSGNYISDMHTFEHMRDLREPIVSMRQGFASDTEIEDTALRARTKYKRILESYEPPSLKKT